MGQVMRNLRGTMPLLQLRLLLVLLMLVAAVVVVAGVARARIHGPKVLSSIVPILQDIVLLSSSCMFGLCVSVSVCVRW